MAKKKQDKTKSQEKETEKSKQPEAPKIPKEMQEKLNQVKGKLDKFKKTLLEKFDKYISGIALLPPPKEMKKEDEGKVHVLVLVDDTEPTKMSKMELKDKKFEVVLLCLVLTKKYQPQFLLIQF